MLKQASKCLEEPTTFKTAALQHPLVVQMEAVLLKAWTDPQVVAPLTTLQPNLKPQGLETKPEES